MRVRQQSLDCSVTYIVVMIGGGGGCSFRGLKKKPLIAKLKRRASFQNDCHRSAQNFYVTIISKLLSMKQTFDLVHLLIIQQR